MPKQEVKVVFKTIEDLDRSRWVGIQTSGDHYNVSLPKNDHIRAFQMGFKLARQVTISTELDIIKQDLE